jgi:hypothetical protein
VTHLAGSRGLAFRFRTTQRARGITGRALCSSTAALEELPLLVFFLALSASVVSLSVEELLPASSSASFLFTSTFFASAAALGRRCGGHGMPGCGGQLRNKAVCPCMSSFSFKFAPSTRGFTGSGGLAAEKSTGT